MYGHFTDLSFDDYKAIKAINFSGMKELARSGAHYQAYLKRPNEITDARIIGTGVHGVVLEPEKFVPTLVSIPGHRGSKDVKAAVEAATLAGKFVVKPEQYETINRMAESVLAKSKRMNLFVGGVAESSVIVKDPATEADMKARPDYLDVDRGVIFDLKTFSNASEPAFRRQLYNMRYDWQSGFYLRAVGLHFGAGITDFVNVVVEDDEPYSVNVIRVDDPTIERATEVIYDLLAKYAKYSKEEVWPDYDDQVVSTNIDLL